MARARRIFDEAKDSRSSGIWPTNSAEPCSTGSIQMDQSQSLCFLQAQEMRKLARRRANGADSGLLSQICRRVRSRYQLRPGRYPCSPKSTIVTAGCVGLLTRTGRRRRGNSAIAPDHQLGDPEPPQFVCRNVHDSVGWQAAPVALSPGPACPSPGQLWKLRPRPRIFEYRTCKRLQTMRPHFLPGCSD
jgi:hypothetical protein